MFASYFPRKDQLRAEQMMTPHEYLLSHRILFLYGIIDEYIKRFDAFGPTLVMDLLISLDKENNAPIKLVIDSPGGYINTGFALLDTIRTIKSPVRTYGRNVQSMGVMLLAAGEKGHRYVYPNSRIMLHLPIAQLSGSSEDIKMQQKEVEFLKEKIVDVLIECGAKKKKKDILKDIDREFWLSAKEGIEYGIVDQIISIGDL